MEVISYVRNTFLEFVSAPRVDCRRKSCPAPVVGFEETEKPRAVSEDNQSTSTSTSFHSVAPTTVMIRGLTSSFGVSQFCELLDSHGFGGSYDFLYVPLDLKTQKCNRFAFVNFGSALKYQAFTDNFETMGFPDNSRICEARIQGQKANIEHLKNTWINSADDMFRPRLFSLSSGARVPFPRPDAELVDAIGSRGRSQSTRGPAKLFIGGLGLSTTPETVAQSISTQFGVEVVDTKILFDRQNGQSRGFGFITLSCPAESLRVLSEVCVIDGKKVDLRDNTSRKSFRGGRSHSA